MPAAGRKRRPARIGLALGAGAARGWAHIGVIERLMEAGIEPDLVCGSSVGALVGAAHVTGHLATLKTWALAYSRLEMIRVIEPRFAQGGVLGTRRMVAQLLALDGKETVEACRPRFACVATDLTSGREVWLREGPLVEAVAASVSMPGIFAPRPHGERWLVDGALVNPVPVSLCRAMGAERVIAVNLNSGPFEERRERLRLRARRGKRDPGEPRGAFAEALRRLLPADSPMAELLGRGSNKTLNEDIPKYLEVVLGSIFVMQDYVTRSRLAGDPPDVLLTPHLQQQRLLDFGMAESAIAEGRASVERMGDALHDLLGA